MSKSPKKCILLYVAVHILPTINCSWGLVLYMVDSCFKCALQAAVDRRLGEILVIQFHFLSLQLSEWLSSGLRQRKKDWQVFQSVPAAKDGSIQFMTGDHLLIPGPRLGKIAEDLVKVLHPKGGEK